MASRPTIADLAARAGVSVATVDRVLNGRHRVREETARGVLKAAQELGYHATGLIRQRIAVDLPEITFGFLLQRPEEPFYQAFGAALQAAVAAAPGIRGRCILDYVKAQTPDEVVGTLEKLGQRSDAVALTSLDHHSVTQAVTRLKVEGKPVFALLSDFAQGIRDSYVGVNNLRVGRTAAWFIARTARCEGKVAIFVGSHRWHGHDLRETGFRSFFREHAPGFEVIDTLINLETPEVTYEATLNLLKKHGDLAGFYVAGGGMEGAIAAVREETTEDRRPVVIINELTQNCMTALQDGIATAAISTPLPLLCREVVGLMTAAVLDSAPAGPPGQLFLPFELYVPESI